MNDVWDMLLEPFPPEEMQWRVEALSKDKRKALVAPFVSHSALLDRLDEVLGPQGWQDSYEVLQAQPNLYAVKCRLTILNTSKEDLGEGDSLKAAFAEALVRAAAKFGVGRRHMQLEQQWVDYDAGTGQFNPPGTETPSQPPQSGRHERASASEGKPEPQELIDRLLERLKQAGLGKQAAQIVVKYGGYGKHPEETRKLYGELRALLKSQAS